MKFEICIDVDDVVRAVDFYGRGLGFEFAESRPDWAQLKLNEQTFWIMKTAAGQEGAISRDFGTPLDSNSSGSRGGRSRRGGETSAEGRRQARSRNSAWAEE
jgi:catechol 2,3-dioxygenase-like lactoylglutathione lyase family enzyme